MSTKALGIAIIIIGALMIAYTGFNYVTTEKLVDIGPIEINKDKNHWVQWSPIVGVVLLIGGFIMMVSNKKTLTQS